MKALVRRVRQLLLKTADTFRSVANRLKRVSPTTLLSTSLSVADLAFAIVEFLGIAIPNPLQLFFIALTVLSFLIQILPALIEFIRQLRVRPGPLAVLH